MSTPSLDQIASAVIGAFPKLSAPEQRAALALCQLLAKCRPVTAEKLSAASAVPGPAVHDMLAKWHGIHAAPMSQSPKSEFAKNAAQYPVALANGYI